MLKKVLVWKKTKSQNYDGKTFELFRIAWDAKKGIYVKSADGIFWGIYHPKSHQVARLYEPLIQYGLVKEVEVKSTKDPGFSLPQTTLDRPSLGEILFFDEEE